MKIDAHQHFWIYNPDEYKWINQQMQVLKRDFLPGDLLSCLQEEQFSGSIAIQARQSLEETHWLLKLARENDFIKGVVGWVDLCSSKVKEQLDEFVEYPEFVGVRHVLQDESDDYFMLKNEFLRGMDVLQQYNLVYDLLVFPKHLPIAVELVKKYPKQKFILDHIGKPRIKEKLISPWKEDLAKLAQYKNVYCKLSGMVTEADRDNWHSGDFVPYINIVIELFGPERLLIGSDWPVCTLAANYHTEIDLVKNTTQGLSEQAQSDILGRSCIKLNNLQTY